MEMNQEAKIVNEHTSVNEIKFKRAIFCLYAVAATQLVPLFYILSSLSLFSNDASLLQGGGLAFSSAFSFGLALNAIVMVAVVKITAELKQRSNLGYLGSIVIFLISLGSLFSLPFGIYGLICLLDREVRMPFLEKLDIKI